MIQETIAATLMKHGILALFGAIVHAANAHRKGTSKTLLDFMLLVIMSSFSGVIFAFIALYMFGDNQQYLTLAIAGTGGYLGVEGMTLIVDKIKMLIINK